MRKFLTNSAVVLGACLAIAGCASKQDVTQKAPGFLPDYTVLKQVPTKDSDVQVYTYKKLGVNRSNYHAVIIDPVMLYQTATESGVTNEQIASAKEAINGDIKQAVSQRLPVVTQAAPGVARLSIAITGAVLEGDSFKPRNLIPVSMILTLASKATGLDNKKPVLMIETKVTDTQTNQLLTSSVTSISGEKFRMEASTPEEFVKLAKMWVRQSVGFSAPGDQ